MLTKRLQTKFTIADNRIAQDKTLSFEARGLYFYMLSLPSDWEFSEQRLANQGCVGIDKIKRILKELFSVGLLSREFSNNDKGHRKYIYTLYDYDTRVNPTLENPTLENPTLENPTLENPITYKELNINKELNKQNIEFEKKVSNETYFSHSLVRNEISHDCVGGQSQDMTPPLEATSQAQPTSQDEPAKETKRGRQGSDSLFEAMPNPKRKQYQAEFEEFWKMYPKKEEKGKAYTLYLQKVPKIISHEELCNRLNQQRKVWEAKRTQMQYIPQCQKWLRNDTFKDNFDEILESYRQDSYRTPSQQASSEASIMAEIDKKIEAGRFTRDMEQEHIELYGRGAIDFDEYMRIFEENERRKKAQGLN